MGNAYFKGLGDHNHPNRDVINNSYPGTTGTNWDCPVQTGVFGHPMNRRFRSS